MVHPNLSLQSQTTTPRGVPNWSGVRSPIIREMSEVSDYQGLSSGLFDGYGPGATSVQTCFSSGVLFPVTVHLGVPVLRKEKRQPVGVRDS